LQQRRKEMQDKQKRRQRAFKGKFRPTRERLREIGKKGMETMEYLAPEDIGKITEEPVR
jgi:general stress protein YciG